MPSLSILRVLRSQLVKEYIDGLPLDAFAPGLQKEEGYDRALQPLHQLVRQTVPNCSAGQW